MARDTEDTPAGRGRTGRISLPLTEDGSIDFGHMRASAKARLCSLVDGQIADIYKEAGQPVPGEDAGDAPPADLFGGLTIENIRTGLDIMSQANVLLVKMLGPRILKHPYRRDLKTGRSVPLVFDQDILQRSFTLTEAQHAELDPRALRLAHKYSHKMPDWFKHHLDFYMLLGMYVKYMGENALTAMQSQVLRDVKTDQEVAAQKRKPAPVDSDRAPTPPPATEAGSGNGVRVIGGEDVQPVTDYTQPAMESPSPAPGNGKTWNGQQWVEL
jgi:hypothetical protein